MTIIIYLLGQNPWFLKILLQNINLVSFWPLKIYYFILYFHVFPSFISNIFSHLKILLFYEWSEMKPNRNMSVLKDHKKIFLDITSAFWITFGKAMIGHVNFSHVLVTYEQCCQLCNILPSSKRFIHLFDFFSQNWGHIVHYCIMW